MKKPLKIYCCYARKDQLLLNKLMVHLKVLERLDLIKVEADVHIKPGAKWEQEIETGIDTSQIILFLVSPDFIASNYGYSVEMKQAIKRHELGKAKVIPLILRPTADWQDTPLGVFQALPSGAEGPKPLTTWLNQDEGFENIVREIRRLVEDIRRESSRTIPISSELLAVLNKHKEKCQKLNIPFDTPHLFLALFDIDHSRTLYHLNNLNPSYATKMRRKYEDYTEKAQKEPERKFSDFQWEERKEMQGAYQLALQNGSNEVTEAYLLLGVLDTETISVTIEALKVLLGKDDFHALVGSARKSLRDSRQGTLDSSRIDWSWDSSDTIERSTVKDINLTSEGAEQDHLAEEEQASKVASGGCEVTLIAGRYEIREHIATGGMASVFKAWDHRLERIVAIKILRFLNKNDRRAVDQFRREARAAAALAHPNAVAVRDFVEEMGQYFLVMEYIQGPTLKQLIAQRRQLQAREAIEIANQVCAVLQVAHARGFIHRDIKPQNIMLALSTGIAGGLSEGSAWVKLTDFGIVRVAEDAGLTNSGIVLGTVDYLSPEQARGETVTGSSDLYSLGVVMFEMLAGLPPFVGPTAVSIAMQHASANPPLLRQFNPVASPALERLVNRALKKEPEDRFSSATEMQEELRACSREVLRGNSLGLFLPPKDLP